MVLRGMVYCQSGPWGMYAQSMISKVTTDTSHGREKWKYSLQVILRRVWPPELHLFLQPFPYPMPCLLSYPGWDNTSRGLNTAWTQLKSFSQHFSYHIKRSLRTWAWQCTCLLVLALQGPMYGGSRQKLGHGSQVCGDESNSVKKVDGHHSWV